MPNIRDLALRNAVLDRTKLLSHAQKIKFLNHYDETFVEGLTSLDMINEIDSYVASLTYLEMTDKYTQEEKRQLVGIILSIHNDRFISCKHLHPQLYQKLMKERFLSIFFSNLYILPDITAGSEKLAYVTVSTNNKMKMEPSKLYGHYEYYQCSIALVTKVDGSQYFYHLNPNRIFGDYMGSIPLELSGKELNDIRNVVFILHPRSMIAYREFQKLQEKSIPFKTIRLPVGSMSVSLSYDTGKDVLIINNIEGGQMVTYNNLLQPPKYNRYQCTPEQYFISQLNNGRTWSEALDCALDKYIATRKEGATWWDLRPLFFNTTTTKANMIAAARIKKEIKAGATEFDFGEVTKNGLLNQLLSTALGYQSEFRKLMLNDEAPTIAPYMRTSLH